MTELRQLPAKLDFVRPPGIVTTWAAVAKDAAGDPVDISGWTLSGSGADIVVTDGAAGAFTITPSATTVGVVPWRLTRTSPNPKDLVAGDDRVSSEADPTPGDVTFDLQLVDGDTVELTVAAAQSSGVAVEEGGVAQGTVGTLNFTGATVTVSGGTATIAISPAGAAALDDLTDVTTAGGVVGDVLTQQADGSFALETPAGGGGGDLSAADIDTLAELNAVLTDATLDDAGDARTPTAHAASHATAGTDPLSAADVGADPAGTAAAAVSTHEGEADPHSGAYAASPHTLGGADHTADTLANLNLKVSDATLDDASASRTPSAHDLAGGLHNAATLAALNLKISDATLDDSGDARTPTAHASTHATGQSDALAPSDIGAALGSGQYAVNTVAASGATETLPATFPAHDVTMDVDCTFTFAAPTAGHTFLLKLSGAFTPTFPAAVVWDAGTAPTYASPSVYGFTTLDGGTSWIGSLVASALA